MNNKCYIIEDFQTKKPFSSFLSGVAGTKGVPIWSFYVSRGQAITSFGTRDKNGAIMEFYPANLAYMYTKRNGFRTFLKVDGCFFEFFNKPSPTQKMKISRDKLIIEEENKELQITLQITYHTIPNESNGGLVRKVKLINNGHPRNIELIDGLAQILPAGIDYGGYKAVSNLLQSWMQVEKVDGSLFYKLRGSTADTAQMSEIKDGNYFYSVSKDFHLNYIYDYKLIFDQNTELDVPIKFVTKGIDDLLKEEQVSVNQVPSAFVAISGLFKREINFISLIGYTRDDKFLKAVEKTYTYEYLNNKEEENRLIHEEITKNIETKTNFSIYDEYMKQNYFDNVLRGGIPYMFETLDGLVGYHVYSRKHGDLERDYNFYSIEPKYFSQGNGNFRDVLQNRRNDLIFNPEIKDANLYQFASLIQADGYNPLSIEGLKFKYYGNDDFGVNTNSILKNEFTPGDIAVLLEKDGLDIDSNLKKVLRMSKPIVKASFGEGYWQDHFTYIYDVLKGVEQIYPDEIDEILFDKEIYGIYNSNIYVKPRSEKYVLTSDNKIRQYNSITHLDDNGNWLKDNKDEMIRVNLASKLITLITTKYARLDPYGIGISYDANKPGWNDAMNGLPAIFSSGVSETVELYKLTKHVNRLLMKNLNKEVPLLEETYTFIKRLNEVMGETEFELWDKRNNVLEDYQKSLVKKNFKTKVIKLKEIIELLTKVEDKLEIAINKAKELDDIIPTFISYEVTDYKVLENNFVKPKEFKLKLIPTFLEGPARYLKIVPNIDEAKRLYKNVKQSELYDKNLKFYKTSVCLNKETIEIGRIRAFTKGWLERESNFLHMTYKYLLSLLSAGLYDEFFEEIKTNYTCFMNKDIYGRPVIENSSFIAPTNNPDSRKHGQGFVSRLTGSTAEMLSMWSFMFFGDELFTYENNELVFNVSPILSKEFFKDGIVRTTLFSTINVIIENKENINTYDKDAVVKEIILTDLNGKSKVFKGSKVLSKWASKIREKFIYEIKIVISKEESKL